MPVHLNKNALMVVASDAAMAFHDEFKIRVLRAVQEKRKSRFRLI
ncbi:MAG: hypothetical protein V1792_00395 [Pseudomonadota bacterium]